MLLIDASQNVSRCHSRQRRIRIIVGAERRRLFRRARHSKRRNHVRAQRRPERAKHRPRGGRARVRGIRSDEMIVQGGDPRDPGIARVAGSGGDCTCSARSESIANRAAINARLRRSASRRARLRRVSRASTKRSPRSRVCAAARRSYAPNPTTSAVPRESQRSVLRVPVELSEHQSAARVGPDTRIGPGGRRGRSIPACCSITRISAAS